MTDEPFEGLLTKSCARVLEVLLANLDNVYTRNELAELSGVCRNTVVKVIRKLSDFRIVNFTRHNLIAINNESGIVKHIIGFNHELSKEVALIEVKKCQP